MNKTIISIVVGLVVVIGGSIAFLATRNNDISMQDPSQSSMGVGEDVAPTAQDTESMQAGSYVEYTPELIAQTPGTKILFFHAEWCPQCRQLDSDLESTGAPAGVTVMKVDYDSSQELRQKYGVTQQTTLVRVDDNGELVEKFVAYDDPSVDSLKANLL